MTLNECVYDLKSKIYTEVSDMESKRRNYEKLKMDEEILKEVIDILDSDASLIMDNSLYLSFQLTAVYGEQEGNRLYDMIFRRLNDMLRYQNINAMDEAKKEYSKAMSIKNKIISDYQEKANKVASIGFALYIEEPRLIEYKRILSNYKYEGLISERQIDLICGIMEKYNFKNPDRIRVLESVRLHNEKVKDVGYKPNYTLVNFLDKDYEKLEIDEFDRVKYEDRFEGVVSSLYNTLKRENSEFEEALELLPDLEESDYNFEEFDYIYKSILNRFVDDLLAFKEEVSRLENYQDITIRKVIYEEIKEAMYKHKKVMYSYMVKKQAYELKMRVSKEIELLNEDTTVNNLIYARGANSDTSYLERDLKDFPEEYLERVKKLLMGKKENSLAIDNDKSFNSTNQKEKDIKELREDQVRIIYTHISDNNYLILGALVKKSDYDKQARETYRSIFARETAFDSEKLEQELEKSVELEKKIFDMIKENSRRGNR